MKKIAMFIHNGHEEVEMLGAVDVMRRAGLQCDIISATGEEMVTGSHNITLKADFLFENANLDSYDAYAIPGGIPGTPNLKAHQGVCDTLLRAYESGKLVAAICAGPTVLGSLGILDGKNATCYPGCEDGLGMAKYVTDCKAITDGNVITSRGLGTALDYGLEIVKYFLGEDVTRELAVKIVYNDYR